MARVAAVLNGWDSVPGATVTRYCSSWVQTTRMAFHAIKAGEAQVIVSAGVETVSRFFKGTSDHLPDTANPRYDDAQARTVKTAETGDAWHDPRADGQLPDVYIAMGQTAENVASLRGISGTTRPPGSSPCASAAARAWPSSWNACNPGCGPTTTGCGPDNWTPAD